jgi:hypothetical protein
MTAVNSFRMATLHDDSAWQGNPAVNRWPAGTLNEEQRAARCESLTAVASRFGVRPLVFFGGDYLMLTAPFALAPIIRNLRPNERRRPGRLTTR